MNRFPVRRLSPAAAVLLAAALPLYAAERVHLSNGFELTCDHRQTVDGRVRLYTGPGSQNFLEVAAADITAVELLPDAPAAGPTPAPMPDDAQALIAQAGARHNLDVDLLASVMRAESGGNARAVSRAGAQGLMQLMPATAQELGVADSFRPAESINGGTAYLDALLVRYNDNLALALAAYNAGPAAVDRYHGVPPYPETVSYVARVIREFNRRKRAETFAAARPSPSHARASSATPGPLAESEPAMPASQ